MIMHYKQILLLCFVLSLTACTSTIKNSSSTSFIKSIYILNNDENTSFDEINESVNRVIFKLIKQNDLIEVGRKGPNSWIKLELNEKINPLENYILEIDRPTLDEVTVYIPLQNKQWKKVQTGDTLEFSKREIDHPNFLFNISGSISEITERTIYIRIKSKTPTSFSLSFLKAKNFHQIDSTNNFYNGLYFGVLFALIVFNLFIFISVRDISYLWYVGYLGFITLFFLAYSGFTFQYLWPNSTYLANKITFIALFLSFASGLLFNRSMLNIEEISPPLSSLMLWTALLIFALHPYYTVYRGYCVSKNHTYFSHHSTDIINIRYYKVYYLWLCPSLFCSRGI